VQRNYSLGFGDVQSNYGLGFGDAVTTAVLIFI
jgi:hypothetical protein